MTPMEFARMYLQPFAVKGSEIIPTYCPLCHGGKNRDKHSFALNVDNQTYNCKRGSCGVQGHFTQLCRDFGVMAEREEYIPPPRIYSKPKIQPKPVHEAAEKYLLLRRISKATSEAYCMGTDEKGNLLFPFFSEKGEHVFSKFRYPRKLEKGERKAWREPGTKPILFGMHLCDNGKPLTIFEGEFDAMAGHEAGIPNAVSVPSGAEDFTWVDTCWDFIGGFNKIYLFGDNDPAGVDMIKRLCAKLSDKKIYLVEHPYKDANEMLYRNGKEAVKAVWDKAKEVPVAGLVRLADVKSLDVTNMPTIRTSIGRLNQVLGGLHYGNVTVVTGKRGEGKSTLVSQFSLDALNGGNRVCVYSGELRADQFQYWADLQAAGLHHVDEYHDSVNNRQVYYVSKENRKKIHQWYGDNYWLYDNSISLEDEELSVLKVFETAAKRYDCRVFAIDNLMTVDYRGLSEKDFYQRQSKFVGQVVNFAKLHNAHVFLVAHPRKAKEGLTADDVSGSADITNRVDNVFSLKREKGEIIDSTLEVIKNRWEGKNEEIGLKFDPVSRRLYTQESANNHQYGWEFQDWCEVAKTEDMPW